MYNLSRNCIRFSPPSLEERDETRMVVAPFSSAAENANRQITTPAFEIPSPPAVAEKSCIFGKLEPFIGETLDFITREEEDLVDWTKRLNKDGKFEYALEIFEWMMDKKKMEFAQEYFNKVEPVFDRTNTRAKNWPAFATIMMRVFEYDRKKRSVGRKAKACSSHSQQRLV